MTTNIKHQLIKGLNLVVLKIHITLIIKIKIIYYINFSWFIEPEDDLAYKDLLILVLTDFPRALFFLRDANLPIVVPLARRVDTPVPSPSPAYLNYYLDNINKLIENYFDVTVQ